MRKRPVIYFLILGFAVTGLNALERGPIAVSPGTENRVVAIVGQSCPTFSWTGVEWATAYRVVVFDAVSAEALPCEEMEAVASPVLSKEIQGRALSWTPSSDERLSNGGLYVWYVQAADSNGTVMWSEGKVFKVEVEARLVGMEEAMRKRLKEHGVRDEVIDDVLRDMESGMKEVVIWGVDTEASRSKTQDKIGIQGLEGTSNTFYGLDAGFSITGTGNDNCFFGRQAGYDTTTGDRNTFIGYTAGYNNTTSFGNTFVGCQAGFRNETGAENTFIGTYAGFENTSASYNTYVGRSAGYYNTTGYNNTFIGYYAGFSNTTGYSNTFMGENSGSSNTVGNNNLFLGELAGNQNTTGNNNIFLGLGAGYSNTTANNNIFIGTIAGNQNTTGNENTFLGWSSGFSNTTGNSNTFIGRTAGFSNTTGYENTYIGRSAGYYNTDGYANTFVGRNAGVNNSSGYGNVFLGYQAGADESGSNKLYIDNSSTSSPLLYGEFDNDILAVNGKLGVGTHSPSYPMHLRKNGVNAAFIADRTDGAMNYINATTSYGNFGTVNNYPLRLVVNGIWKMRLNSDQSLAMANGASCTAGGVWTDASSRDLKENIQALSTEEAVDVLDALNPVKYNYKVDKEEDYLGFIAEDVPDMVASKDKKGMSPMDVVAILTKVLQDQKEIVKEHKKTINELQKRIEELERKSQIQK